MNKSNSMCSFSSNSTISSAKMDESTQQLNEKCGEIFVERIYDSEVFSFTCVFCDKATFTEISDFFEHFKDFHTKSFILNRKFDPLEFNNDEDEDVVVFEDNIHQPDLNEEFETVVKDSNELVTNSDISDNYVESNRSQRLSSNMFKNDTETTKNILQPRYPCKMCDKKYFVQSSLRRHMRLAHKRVNSNHADNCTQHLNLNLSTDKSKQTDKRRDTENDSNGEGGDECVLENSVTITTILHSDDVGDGNSPMENSNINVCKDKSIYTEEPSDNGMYSCMLCEKKYSVKSCLRRHIRNVHISPNDFIKCSHCDRSVKRHYLKEHERIHTGEKEFKCKFCNKCFQLPSYLKKHERLHLGIRYALACRRDNEHTNTKFVTNSFDNISSESSSTQINCEYKEENVKDNDGNNSIKLDVFAQPHEIDPFMCRYCYRGCKNRTERMEHECLHTGEKPFKCERCDKRFRLKAQLRVHLHVHDGIKPYKCKYCDAAFTHAQNRNVHEKRHLGEKKFKCNYCDMRFVATTDRRQHERSHTGEKPFQCNECGLFYATSFKLSAHSKTHLGIKSFECRLCDKKFYSNRDLKVHSVVHTGERPFECEKCNAKFSRSSSLRSHRKIHSDVAAYICKICGKGFKQQPGLYCHMKSHGIPMKS